MSKLSATLREYIAGCFTGIWIETHEPREALAELQSLCRESSWNLVSWSLDGGLRVGSGETPSATTASDPIAAINTVAGMGNPSQTSILVLENFHRFLSSFEIVQTLSTRVQDGKQTRVFYVILSPVVELPIELEKLFVVVQHELPGRDQLFEIARGVATQPGELPEGPALDTLLDAAGGLTRHEAESAYSLSLVRHGTLRPDALWELKTGLLKKVASSSSTGAEPTSNPWVALGPSSRSAARRWGADNDHRSCGPEGSCCSRRRARAKRNSARRSGRRLAGRS